MRYEVYYSPTFFYDENIIKVEDKKPHLNYYYSECPVWSHKFCRTFTGYSPIDFQIDFSDFQNKKIYFAEGNQEFQTIDIDCINNEGFYQGQYFQFHLHDIVNDHPVIQLKFIESLIWTNFDKEYLWFEFLDHPITSYQNNFFSIEGWFNIANYPRTTSLAIKVVDLSRPIKIMKGDPLYRVKFYTEDLNDLPVLIKKKPPIGLEETTETNREMLLADPNLLNKILFDKNIRTQCPFHNV